ncbi:SpoIIE family protein phosphatase [Ramlibacter sp. AW1]|uniref:SpoIIE family protein phosphatase n=1 Tax=Ramlibacter aurantiacus TaxID=2801330 RepID=A0A936ZJE6_9BURK|nr:SpoIIE family protein phosphatase [Ramlibacter aurantiacus]MBL0422007.1 SpoIIE family protein phosphatase [Ramlibacter aurantiacus]
MNAPAPELRFFRNYNRKIGLAYAVLLLVLVVFLVQQLRRSMADEIESIQGHLQRHHQFLEFVLRSSADEVDSLRMAAGPLVAEPRPARSCGPVPARWAAAGLRERPNGGFDRDALADLDAGGNLVGQGGLRGRDVDFYCDLDSALGLDPRLQALAFQRPQAARTRFISVHGFHLVSPWRPSEELPFDGRVFDDPVWHMGQPAQNPERLKFWGPSFFAGDEAGLLVPVAAPVYEQARFMGVVSLDMSLDHLHRVNASFGYPLGSVAVVDSEGSVLANPAIYGDPLSVRSLHRLVHLFSPGLLTNMDDLRALPDGEAAVVDDWLVIRRGFTAAPWELVYAVARTDLWLHLLSERAPAMGAALLAIALMMALIYAISSREFVAPAARLVEHLIAESRLQPRPMPRVPKAWRPWFEAITQGFRHSVELSTLRNELDIAAAMQQSILPRQWPSDTRYSLWGSTAPAREVGGDFFDHFELADGRRALVVADVSGKGIAAGLFAMVAKTLLRSLATHRLTSPAEVAAQVNNGLCVDNDNSTFVTGVHLQYDPGTGSLAYVNAGHPPPLLVRADGRCEWLPATGGTAFGVMEDLVYTQRQASLAPGDTVLMYTDGVTEGEDESTRQFGAERLLALFEGRPPTSAQEAVQRIIEAARRFAGKAEQFDDITGMAVHCLRHGALP